VIPWTFQHPGPFLVAGPCVIEPGDLLPRVGEALAELGRRLDLPVCFKASFDKANRARPGATRGPGLEEGLRALERVRAGTGLPVLTDIHESGQGGRVAEVVDALQIPAFLCRQTDLLLGAGATGRRVNIKKGLWMAAVAWAGAADTVRGAGTADLAVTERGSFFGYGDLVVDFRNFARLRAATGAPVLFDASHAVQQPGQGEVGSSGGLREHIPALMRAAAVAGADGFFIETHPDPASAASDAATQWPLDALEDLVRAAVDLWHAARAHAHA
jgi:2-dehydro-3-deoxyphosphooctonate aldolase (KDO 8-P synthase)